MDREKQWVAIARMNIALMRMAHAGYFPRTLSLAEGLVLRAMMQHAFLWEAEHRPATVSKMSRALGLSRSTTRRRLAELIMYGYLRQDGRHYLCDRQLHSMLQRPAYYERYTAIIAQTCKDMQS